MTSCSFLRLLTRPNPSLTSPFPRLQHASLPQVQTQLQLQQRAGLKYKRKRPVKHDPYTLSNSRVNVSRQVAKLQQMDTRYGLTPNKKVARVIDFGAAPGSWTQHLWSRQFKRSHGAVEPAKDGAQLISVDMTPLAPRIVETGNYPCIDVVQGDVRVPETLQEIERLLDGHKADLIVADLLANPHDLSQRDTRYSRELSSIVWDFAKANLNTGRDLVIKFYNNQDERDWGEAVLAPNFREYHRHNSTSRRPEPRESFHVCKGFRKGVLHRSSGEEDSSEEEKEEQS